MIASRPPTLVTPAEALVLPEQTKTNSYFGLFSPVLFAESDQPTSVAPPTTTETAAIRAQIEANNRAVGHAIVTMDFGALEKLWAPVMEVNSPGNNILTREQVFTAMREDKLKYTSSKAFPEAFFVSGIIAIEMGHDDVVMANGPMAGKPLTRRFTNVWQKMVIVGYRSRARPRMSASTVVPSTATRIPT